VNVERSFIQSDGLCARYSCIAMASAYQETAFLDAGSTNSTLQLVSEPRSRLVVRILPSLLSESLEGEHRSSCI
jgi:hypothetical protein